MLKLLQVAFPFTNSNNFEFTLRHPIHINSSAVFVVFQETSNSVSAQERYKIVHN